MNLDYFREFIVFSQDLNYTEAAKKLYLSQPTLSQHIGALEKELGVSLVDRQRQPKLTLAGAHLAVRARDLIEMYDDIISELNRMVDEEQQQIRIVDYRGILDIHDQIVRAKQTAQVSLKFVDQIPFGHAPIDLLNQDLADIVIDFFPDSLTTQEIEGYFGEDIGVIPLDIVPCVVIVRKDHPVASLEKITFSDLARYRIPIPEEEENNWYVRTLRNYLEDKAQFSIFPASVNSSNYVLSGSYLSIATEHAAQARHEDSGGDLIYRPFAEPGLFLRPVVLWKTDTPRHAVTDFAIAWRAQLED